MKTDKCPKCKFPVYTDIKRVNFTSQTVPVHSILITIEVEWCGNNNCLNFKLIIK